MVDLVRRDAVRIPPFPAVAFQLSRLLADEKSSMDEIGRVAAADQIVAASLLRAATSAANSRVSGESMSLAKAVARLGAKETQRIVFAAAFGALTRGPGSLLAVRERIWRESVVSAFVVSELAQRRGLPRDEAFLCGLLHDFGKVVVVTALEELLGATPADAATLAPFIERFHVEVGLITATRWRLAEALLDAMARHHLPPTAATRPELIEVLAIADVVTHLLEAHLGLRAQDLAKAPYLRPGEAEALVACVAQMPAKFAGLVNLGPARPLEPKSGSSDVPATEGWRPVSFPAVVQDHGTVSFEVRFFHPKGFVVAGPVALVENHLHSFALTVDDFTLSVWGHSRVTLREGNTYIMDIKPFASSGQAMAALAALLAPPDAVDAVEVEL